MPLAAETCPLTVSPEALASGRAALLAAGYQLAQFTPDEEKCIASKMEAMKGEDKEQDQKVAIAIKHCAPEKARSTQAAPSKAEPLPRRYQADRNADGTWNVRDVPITAVADDLGEDMRWLTREWLQGAIAAAAKKHADDGYLPPLHVDHHFRGEEVRGAGRFLLRRLGEHLYEGKPRLFAFADLLRIRPEVFDELRRGELPYRSIEALDYANRSEVDSLALGDHWVPFFRMPLLDGDAIEVREIRMFRARAVPVACLAAAGTIRWITLTGGKAMAEQIEEKKEPAKLGRFGAALAKIAADLAKLAAEADGDEDEGDGLPDMAPAEQGQVPTMAMAAQEGTNAAMLARMAALEKRAQAGEDKAKTAGVLDAAERTARRYGITRADLEKKEKAHGLIYVQAFVDSLKSHGTPLDEVEDAATLGATSAGEADIKEVALYQAQGPAALACARKLATEWRGSKMLKSAGTLEQYLDTNLVMTLAEGR